MVDTFKFCSGPDSPGRTIFIGDLHGETGLLGILLDALNFDPSADRVYSCGDLCDRGPDSLGALRLAKEPWFAACRGNHEDFMHKFLRAAREGMGMGLPLKKFFSAHGQALRQMSSEWLWDVCHEGRLEELIDELLWLTDAERMPHVRRIGCGGAGAWIAHAQLPLGPHEGFGALENIGGLGAKAREQALHTLLWEPSASWCRSEGAVAMEEAGAGALRGGDFAVLGHTIYGRPVWAGRRLFLDTGCGAPGLPKSVGEPRLSALEMPQARLWSVDYAQRAAKGLDL